VIEPSVVDAPMPASGAALVEIAVGGIVVRLPGDAPAERIAAIARALLP
jgi:hypothetical protein